MAIARTAEYPIYYEEAGRGLPLVLIHGHSVDLRMWDEVVPELAGAGFRVIRYDVRGHGRSAAPDHGYTWEAYLSDLEGLLANVGVQEVALCGFSMGGGIALSFAEEHAERTAALVLVDSTLPGFTYSEEFSKSIVELQAAIRANGVHPTMEELFPQHAMFDQIRSDADAMDKLHAMMAGYSGKEYLEPDDEKPPYDPQQANRLGLITAATLVMAGEHDVPDMRAISTILSEGIAGAELQVVEGAGHMLPMERPKAFAAAVAAFLKAKAVSPLLRR